MCIHIRHEVDHCEGVMCVYIQGMRLTTVMGVY